MCVFWKDFPGDCVRLDRQAKRLCFSESGSVELEKRGHCLSEV